MMRSAKVVTVFMTASSWREAERVAEALVGERLAACVNMLGSVRSVYRWDGEVCRGREVAMLAKTTAPRVKSLAARVCELHSYDVPCVVAWPVVAGSEAFLRWVAGESAPVSRSADRRPAGRRATGSTRAAARP